MSDLQKLLDSLVESIAQRVVELEREEAVTYLTPDQMAKRMGVAKKTLQNLRSRKMGPKYEKIGGVIRYPVDLLTSFRSKRLS